MFQIEKVTAPSIGIGTLDVGLSEEELALQETLDRFAVEVMRPIGQKLDAMTPEEVCAEGSPLFDYLEQYDKLGVGIDSLLAMSPEENARMMPIIFESLSYGDVGLALLPMVRKFPSLAALATEDPEIIERFSDGAGCWLATQPDRGSDVVDFDGKIRAPGTAQKKGNIHVKVTDDELIINGASSAWVSGAPIATGALAYIPADFGDGIMNKKTGTPNGAALLIPFDEPGVSKGKPLHKMGQRPLPQGEVFFDNVRLPKKYLLGDNVAYNPSFFAALTFANMDMSLAFTGLARAAYEYALEYAHEREQAGVPIVEHQSVQHRLFSMWSKLETCRALSKRVTAYNFLSGTPHLVASATGKVVVTKLAYEVASEALQMFGGNGLTKEYPLEKLFRDARAGLIEDGENNILELKTARYLSDHFKEMRQIKK